MPSAYHMILGSVGSNDALFTSIWHPTAPKLRYHLHLNRGAPGPHLFGSKNHLALLPGATHGASGAEEGNEPSTPVRSIKTAKLFSRSPDPPADVGRLSQHNNHCFAYKDLYNIYIYGFSHYNTKSLPLLNGQFVPQSFADVPSQLLGFT